MIHMTMPAARAVNKQPQIGSTTQKIVPGMYVEFDTEYGPKTGFVTAIRRDLTNGRETALIEIDNELDAHTYNVPLDVLKTSEKYNFFPGRFN
ncbi:hypothetical protein ACO0K2_04215 [Undibacterium sp. MH2W]|uniref:hypothetical protein n=1 Tax=Undibacterium sp. MH2W TaxID=3413044 RepID=UPI003BF0F0F5